MSASVPSAPSSAAAPAVPLPAQRLAYAGLIPFAVGAVLVWVGLQPVEAHEFVVLALLAYATLVVGFLAGIHWGAAMRAAAVAPADYGVPLLLWGEDGSPKQARPASLLMPRWPPYTTLDREKIKEKHPRPLQLML